MLDVKRSLVVLLLICASMSDATQQQEQLTTNNNNKQEQLAKKNTTSASEELLISGIPFDCSGKPTGFYKDTKYCDIFHVCVSFQQRKTYGCPQLGAQFYYDETLKMCEFRARNPTGCLLNNYYQSVEPIKFTTQAPQQLTTEPVEAWKTFVRQADSFSCLSRVDGFYPSRWCNVFYRCANGARFEFQCAKQLSGERLWWTEHSESGPVDADKAQCAYPCDINRPCSSPGGLLVESENGTVISESRADIDRILGSCQAPDGQDKPAEDHQNDIFRLPAADQSTANQSCIGQPDGSFQGDDNYCNVFHVCYAGTRRDFICAKAIHSDYELWWDASKNRCDWPCKVKCNKGIFGGAKNAQEIQRVDRLINAADCQVSVKHYKYAFLQNLVK